MSVAVANGWGYLPVSLAPYPSVVPGPPLALLVFGPSLGFCFFFASLAGGRAGYDDAAAPAAVPTYSLACARVVEYST